MRTIVPTSTYAIPSSADGAYVHEMTAAITSAAGLVPVLLIAWLFVFATFKIVRLFIDALRLSPIVADCITGALLAAVVVIGLLHR
ncbi:hypothetical protein [Actinoplanes utahensis]|nr:hypothetical protein [Actinoplanes utahensis]GIF34468.1 hypothetical protein Aut01nite_74540 [Actinoplanes utahensis]